MVSLGRPAKSTALIEIEGKSHRTKAELEARKKAEEELTSGVKLKEFREVKNNPIAHKEFKRLAILFGKIKNNDDLHAGPINRYCMLKAECNAFEEQQEKIQEQFNKLYELDGEYDQIEIIKLQSELTGQLLSIDRQLQNKRKMMLDIEKENLMTMASALRSIPKKIVEEENDNDSLFD